MREVQGEYTVLSEQLKREEEERDAMMQQIGLCFEKLEKMEHALRDKRAKKVQEGAQE